MTEHTHTTNGRNQKQAEFKATHKQVDQVRSADLRPGELRTEIGQLEDEKKQLTEKISKLKGNVSGEPGIARSQIRVAATVSTVELENSNK